VATDKLPYVKISEKRGLKRMGKFISHLSEDNFLRSQLSEKRFKRCSTYVVIESAEVELASCAI
jgi:hypothetical protein